MSKCHLKFRTAKSILLALKLDDISLLVKEIPVDFHWDIDIVWRQLKQKQNQQLLVLAVLQRIL